MEEEGSVRREVYRVAREKEGRKEEGMGKGMERGRVGGLEEMKEEREKEETTERGKEG